MLGTRTKQVFSYGRRGHRIVNAADESKERNSGESLLCSGWKKRGENVSRPPAVGQRKKVPDSSGSESASDSSYSLSSTEIEAKKSAPPKRKQASRKSKKLSPVRKPLSAVSANLPTPRPNFSAGRVPKKNKAPSKRTTPIKALKPSSPVVEVDIVILDERGHKVSQERRVSRTNILPNPVPKAPPKRVKKAVAGTSVAHAIVLSDDEFKAPVAKKPPKQSKPKPIVISSDEESDGEPVPLAKLPSLQLSSDSPLPKPAVRRNRRVTTVLSPPTSPDVEIIDTRPAPGAYTQPANSRIAQKPTANASTAAFRRKSAARVDAAFPAALLSPPAPYFKSRQTTPVRYGGRPSFMQGASSGGSESESDLEDLDFDLSQLALSPRTLKQLGSEFALHEKPPAKHLVPLLEECAQSRPHEFSAFIDTFPLDAIVQTSHGGVDIVGRKGSKGPVSFQKIGEASYSEVFGIGDVVLKVIPLRNQEDVKFAVDDPDSPAPSDAKDVLKEIIVTRAMGEMCDGFVELLRTYVVRGKYPSLLLDLWDEYNERKGSENVRPGGYMIYYILKTERNSLTTSMLDTFTVSQVYAIIVLPNGGPDIETYTFPKGGWRQASSLFWQVARTLAIAEDLVHFEVSTRSLAGVRSFADRNKAPRLALGPDSGEGCRHAYPAAFVEE